MKKFAYVALFLIGDLFGPKAHAADPVAASVRVDCPQGGGVVHSGSGTVVAVEDGRALVLTNRHVASHDGPMSVRFPDGKGYDAVWLGTDATADLAALCIAAPKCEPCPPATAHCAAGVTVVQVGYPRACAAPVRRTGQFLANVARLMTGVRVTHAAVPTVNGDSGSGVFADGELVAVVWGGDGGTCSCVALEDVHRFVRGGRVAKLFPQLAVKVAGPPDAKPRIIDAKFKPCPAGKPHCDCGCAGSGTCVKAHPGSCWQGDGTGDAAYFDGTKFTGWYRKDRGGFVYAGETKVYPMACPARSWRTVCTGTGCQRLPVYDREPVTFAAPACSGGCCRSCR